MKNAPRFAPAARWIWHPDLQTGVNQYVCFRKEFTLAAKPGRADLAISVDSDYALYLNGVEISGRQYSDYPQHRSYDTHNVTRLLKKGANVIAILGYYRGLDCSDYRKGLAGLIVQHDAGRENVVTDNTWLCRPSPAFASGPIPRCTPQMGYTVQYDARREDAWTQTDFTSGAEWKNAGELAGPTDGFWKSLSPRPLPRLAQGELLAARCIAIGEIIRRPDDTRRPIPTGSRFVLAENQTQAEKQDLSPAQAFACDFKRVLPISIKPGAPVTLEPPRRDMEGGLALFDLGREDMGLLRFTVDAPEGAVLDVAHGEHLEDLGVRSFIFPREFTDRYICRAGRQEFRLPFRRLGARYIQFHVTRFSEPVTLVQAGIEPVRIPARRQDAFDVPDRLFLRIREAGVRTLELSMADHFADCPWREQSLYAWDSRNSALFNYYTYGDYDFCAQSFRLLGWGQRKDGLLELCAPARVPITIPVFSLLWISAVRDNVLFSGRNTLFLEFRPAIERVLEAFVARYDQASGLYGLFIGQGFWTFYEWAPGLDFKNGVSFEDDGVFRLDAPHNLLLIEAMESFAQLLEFNGEADAARGWRKRAAALRKAIQKIFWDSKRKAYATYADRKKIWHYCESNQVLALVMGLGTPAARNDLRRRLFTSGDDMVPITLSPLQYAARAMLGADGDMQRKLYQFLQDTYAPMLYSGATTLWETQSGAEDFDKAGSLCHPWSSVSIWVGSAYLLGVQPLTPGFKTFQVQPHAAALPCAHGTIPTPAGPIHVAWERFRGTCHIDIRHPKGLTAVPVATPVKGLKYAWTINGKTVRVK